MAEQCDIVIACLPLPAASATVMEADDGILVGLLDGKIWGEMSTTDGAEMTRIRALVKERGADPFGCPVSGGCRRATTSNIAIFVGCEQPVFENLLPVLKILGRRVLHTGGLGTVSVIEVVTNYLNTVNLATLCELLVTSNMAGMDLNVAYEAIRI